MDIDADGDVEQEITHNQDDDIYHIMVEFGGLERFLNQCFAFTADTKCRRFVAPIAQIIIDYATPMNLVSDCTTLTLPIRKLKLIEVQTIVSTSSLMQRITKPTSSSLLQFSTCASRSREFMFISGKEEEEENKSKTRYFPESGIQFFWPNQTHWQEGGWYHMMEHKDNLVHGKLQIMDRLKTEMDMKLIDREILKCQLRGVDRCIFDIGVISTISLPNPHQFVRPQWAYNQAPPMPARLLSLHALCEKIFCLQLIDDTIRIPHREQKRFYNRLIGACEPLVAFEQKGDDWIDHVSGGVLFQCGCEGSSRTRHIHSVVTETTATRRLRGITTTLIAFIAATLLMFPNWKIGLRTHSSFIACSINDKLRQILGSEVHCCRTGTNRGATWKYMVFD